MEIRDVMRFLTVTIGSCGLLLLSHGAAAQLLIGTGTTPALEQQIVDQSERWADAIEQNDLETIDALMAEDFVLVQATPQGIAMVGKATQLKTLERRSAAVSGAARMLGGITVRTHGGDMAILTAVATYSAEGTTGEPLTTQAVITEVWTDDGAGWKISHFQLLTGPLPGPTEPTE